jgi:hypothetical protein
MATKRIQHRQYLPKSVALARQGKFGRKPEITDTRGTEKMEIDYFRFFESLYRKEVDDWISAREARRNPFNPITYPIQQLYKDSMLDNHLQGAIENRILRVLNKEFVIKDGNGDVDKKRSTFVQTRWFRHVVRKAMESKFYGYSLLLIADFSHGQIRKLIDPPRENVLPERGVLIKNAFDPHSAAIPYNEFPNFLIYIQLLPEAIGILERIAPMTIFKRHSWASWDEFEQIFGVPIRIARTMINTKKHKDELQEWLETMGTANYGIFDKQTEIEIKENTRHDSFNVFLQKISAINKEISKGIVGQTMTMEDGSSQSQAEVHLKIYDEITSADIMDIQDWATDDFFPVMRAHGYDIPEGYYLQLVEREIIKPIDKIKIDQPLLAAGYNIDPNYIQEFYGTPLDENEPRRGIEQPELSLKLNDLADFFV